MKTILLLICFSLASFAQTAPETVSTAPRAAFPPKADTVKRPALSLREKWWHLQADGNLGQSLFQDSLSVEQKRIQLRIRKNDRAEDREAMKRSLNPVQREVLERIEKLRAQIKIAEQEMRESCKSSFGVDKVDVDKGGEPYCVIEEDAESKP